MSVREMWELALGPAAELLGGEQGLDGEVQWVTGLRATYPLFPDLDAGHLAIASPEVARRIDEQLTLDYLMRQLARAQASALVIDEAPTLEDRALADALGLPLFSVPHETDLRLLERDALRALLDKEGYEARRAGEWRQQYQDLLMSSGVGAVLDDLAHEFSAEVELVDGMGTVLESSGGRGLQAASTDGNRTIYPVAVTGRALGCLRVTAPVRAPALLPVAARLAAEVCALEMLQTCIRREAEDQLSAEIVVDLLSSNVDLESVMGRLTRQGYDLAPGRRHVAIALSAPYGAPPGVGTLAANLESDLRFAGRREGICTLLLSYQDLHLCLLSLPGQVSDQRLKAWLLQAIGAHATKSYRISVSRALPDAVGLPTAVQQALAGEALGRRLRDWEGPLFYSDLGLYRLLLGLRDQAEVQRFYSDTLGPLVDYDREHNTSLVATLRAFFEQNANASETARKLYVHRNTLNYRLQRISEIAGLDLDSADTRLALQVALRIHYLGS